jgi:Xaa-Pro aminopeptidase
MTHQIESIQTSLREQRLDGWLFYDHHVRDPLAYRILDLHPPGIVSRRWYYFIPSQGEPRGLVHRIESHHLDELAGSREAYSSWEEQAGGIQKMLGSARRIAMQWSPKCAIPLVSLVDGGTVDLIRSLGIEVVSSADLIQHFEARWNQNQLDGHLEAGKRVDAALREAFRFIGEHLRSGNGVTEWEVTEFLRGGFEEGGLFTDHGPDCAVNANASNPHYEPKPDSSAPIRQGDVVLIDLWAKLKESGSVYYDITWMGYCGALPPTAVENVFTIVRDARDAAVNRVKSAVAAGTPIRGFEVDDAARAHIREKGFEQYFIHRTGHSIGEDVHGAGANMDNLETHDDRRIIPWTCFSVEPGIYLPEFGVRSEVNMFVGEDAARVTGAVQDRLILLGQ